MSPSDSSSCFDLAAFAALVMRYARHLVGAALIVSLVVGVGYALLGKHRAEGLYTLGALENDEKKKPPLHLIHGIAPHAYKTIAPLFHFSTFAEYATRSNEALLELGTTTALRTRGLQFIVAPAIAEREPGEAVLVDALAAVAVLALGLLLLLLRQWVRPTPHSERRPLPL